MFPAPCYVVRMLSRVTPLFLLVALVGCSGSGATPDAGADGASDAMVDGAVDGAPDVLADGALDALGVDAAGDADPGDGGPADAGPGDAGRDASPEGLLAGSHRVLFLGNSYTGVNQLHQRYLEFAGAADLAHAPLETVGVTPGGYRLSQHAADARTDGTAQRRWLVTGTPEERAWDVLVLQDQSQVPGFGATHPETSASSDGALELAALADATDTPVVLYLTWGRRDGDTRNPGVYPDFLTMQASLEAGYRGYAQRMTDAGYAARIAPIGPGFRLVHQDVVAAGGVPTDPGSSFHALYASDGSHPSMDGTYLAACVLYATITERDPEGVDWRPASVDADRALYLRRVAQRAALAERGE